jgi:hypothetical protein
MKKYLKVWLAAGLLGAASFAALPAHAQQPAQPDAGLGLNADDQDKPKELPKPPIARKSDPSPPVLWNILAFLIIVGFVFGANMIPSKRGHQD